MISVFDTLFNESSVVYKHNADVNDHLYLPGPPDKQTDKSNIHFLRVNGAAVRNYNAGLLTGLV